MHRLKLFLRNGIWHYAGTIGPPERRSRLRGSCFTSDKATAARQVSEIERDYWKGHHDGPGSILTFGEAAELYKKAGKGDRFLNPVEEHLKDKLVKSITPQTILEMATTLFPDCSGASKNRCALTPALAVINFCAESGLCSPIKVKGFKEETREKTPADMAWVQGFRRQASDHLGADALFMFLTGARPSEALTVRPEDLRLSRAEVLIRESKVSKERVSHLPPLLVSVLANLTRIEDRPVFGYRTYADMYQTWLGVVEAAKIERLTPHCCRHGFATELLRRGVDIITVAWLGGWATPAQVLKTYGHALRDRSQTNVLIDTDLTQAVVDVVQTAGKTGAI